MANEELFDLQTKLFEENKLVLEYDQSTQKTAEKKPERKFKWSTSVDESFKFDFSTAKPESNINKINWSVENIKGVERSQSGSEGLFFVDSETGAFVLKRTSAICQEAFCALLAQKLGIYSPKFSLISTNSDYGISMLNTLKEKDNTGRVGSTLWDLAYLLLIEYIPCHSLKDLDYQNAKNIFGDEQLPDENGCKRLFELGCILALDVLVNNCDRLPLIWEHQGNPGNVILTKGKGQMISIDGKCVVISNEEGENEYLEKVKNLVSEITSKPEVPSTLFLKMKSKIQEFCDYDMGENGVIEIQKGFLSIINNSKKNEILESLNKFKDLLMSFDPPLIGVEDVSPEFVNKIWQIFHDN